jgi:hypothetical protein
MVHLAFRSAETGRYLFHCKVPKAEYELWERFANRRGQTVEEFIVGALRAYLDE